MATLPSAQQVEGPNPLRLDRFQDDLAIGSQWMGFYRLSREGDLRVVIRGVRVGIMHYGRRYRVFVQYQHLNGPIVGHVFEDKADDFVVRWRRDRGAAIVGHLDENGHLSAPAEASS